MIAIHDYACISCNTPLSKSGLILRPGEGKKAAESSLNLSNDGYFVRLVDAAALSTPVMQALYATFVEADKLIKDEVDRHVIGNKPKWKKLLSDYEIRKVQEHYQSDKQAFENLIKDFSLPFPINSLPKYIIDVKCATEITGTSYQVTEARGTIKEDKVDTIWKNISSKVERQLKPTTPEVVKGKNVNLEFRHFSQFHILERELSSA